MKLINKYAIGAIAIIVILIVFFAWRAIDKVIKENRVVYEQIERLKEKSKRDSIQGEFLRARGDSLQLVANAFKDRASKEHQARLDLLEKQKNQADKKINNATAREAIFSFMASVDSGRAVIPDLIAKGNDTIAPISYLTIKRANLLFSELNYTRQAIEEHKVFEDDLIYIINDLNESSNVLRAEADTWKQSTEDLKQVNKNMQVIIDRKDKKLSRSRTWNTIFIGALGLVATKVILF